MTKILITGATGFIGAHFACRAVRRNAEIHVFIRPETHNLWRLSPVLKNIKIHRVDLTEAKTVERTLKKINPAKIYHFSAYGTYPFHQNSELVLKTNILGSLNLFLAAQQADNVQIIVNAGSSSEYGVKKRPMREDEDPNPNTLYGIAKLSQTLLANYFSHHGKVPIVTMRFFSVYGPYEEPGRFVPALLKGGITRTPVKISSLSPRRDFIYIADIIDVLEKAGRRPDLGGEIFNTGTGNDHSIGEVIAIAQRLFNQKITILCGAVSEREFDNDIKWEADIAKIREKLKWQPKYSLEQGLMKTRAWLQQNMHFYE